MNLPDRVGPYTLLSRLGVAKDSRVFLASAGPLGTTRLALKLALAGDTEGRASLRREAAVLIGLHHPNVVRLHECGEAQGHTWLTMPLLAFPHAPLKLGHFRQLLMGLNHVHGNDFVHSNIRRSSLLLDAGVLKIAKFGCARRAGQGADEVLDGLECSAPEQALGLALDRRADIYAAGAVLFELLTGQSAFAGTAAQRREQLLQGIPAPPSTLAPRLGERFDSLVATAMAREPGERFGSAFEFLGEFDRACRETGKALFG